MTTDTSRDKINNIFIYIVVLFSLRLKWFASDVNEVSFY